MDRRGRERVGGMKTDHRESRARQKSINCKDEKYKAVEIFGLCEGMRKAVFKEV